MATAKPKTSTVRITQAVAVGDRLYSPGVIENCTDPTLLALAEQGIVAQFVGGHQPHASAAVSDGGKA